MSDRPAPPSTREHERLDASQSRDANWQRWGTYLPERQWGTKREDYSADGNPWTAFTHDMARYRAYRWGEDGLLGWTDRQCRICFATTVWNGHDPILKERLFGLTNPEGNHGEDVKELFYYLDATPTHSYAKALYKYPQAAYPYEDLIKTNKARGFTDREYELLDTGVFDGDRYFDVLVEYAKADVEDTLIRLTITNRGPEAAPLCVMPTLTLRNNWSWRTLEVGTETKPWMKAAANDTIIASHAIVGRFRFQPVGDNGVPPELLFTENDTNIRKLDPGFRGQQGYTKDAFHRYVVGGETDAVNPHRQGTRATLLHRLTVAPGASVTLRFRLVREDGGEPPVMDQAGFEACFTERIGEADAFYATVIPQEAPAAEIAVARQAYAGLLWSKQFYYYVAKRWADGDPAQPSPPEERAQSHSTDWSHLFCRDVLSMPDKWEYPWFAAWDLAFHMIAMVRVDPQFAKFNLSVLLREWYLHPNGQLPAYENAFSDVNPPVHAFAVFQVYAYDAQRTGEKDLDFLEGAFHKLMLNFTWWVNRNDADGLNLFGGGFLGLDNIGVFDRDMKLPNGVSLSQADATAWMGLFCASMLRIAVELAQHRPIFQDIASKFFGHYIAIIDAINSAKGGLWDEEEGFYFDQLATDDDRPNKLLKLHSIVGIVPLFAVLSLRRSELDTMPEFKKRMHWMLEHQPDLAKHVMKVETDDPELAGSYYLSLVPKDRLERILRRTFADDEFMSPHGVRALSKLYGANPFEIELADKHMTVHYAPAEGVDGMFGGNSNWRGPVWFPINGLLINALMRYHAVLGDGFLVESPSDSGRWVSCKEAAHDLAKRCVSLFVPGEDGARPCHGGELRYRDDPAFRDLVLFYEYFSGDDGRGVGASHQTGWTALVAPMIEMLQRGYKNMF